MFNMESLLNNNFWESLGGVVTAGCVVGQDQEILYVGFHIL